MLFDSHCHPQFAAYDNDREEVIRRALDEGVLIIAVGTSYETSAAGIELAKTYRGKIWATAGIHPHHAAQNPHDPMETRREIGAERIDKKWYGLAALPEVVAIGECGLDYHYLKPVPGDNHIAKIQNSQRENFLAHIELAKAVKKPLVIHARDAYRDVLEILCAAQFQHGTIMHFFQGTPTEAQQFLDLGAYISFAGLITFTGQYDETIKSVPLDRILIETDAPYASPASYRGQRNEPRFVRYIAERIAEIKNIDCEEVIQATSRNAKNVFMI